MIEKRTAEEILDKHIAIKLEAIPDIVPAMHEYAAQELADYKTKLKEALDKGAYTYIWKVNLIELIDKL